MEFGPQINFLITELLQTRKINSKIRKSIAKTAK